MILKKLNFSDKSLAFLHYFGADECRVIQNQHVQINITLEILEKGSILFPPPPPPPRFFTPQLQIICCYLARYYVKKIARAPGGLKI